MASQEQDWTKATSKSRKKKDKERADHESLKQQYADYLHTKSDGLEDISDFDDEEYIPETPEVAATVAGDDEIIVEETAEQVTSGVKDLTAYAAWLRRGREFEVDPRYKKEELSLLKYDIRTKDRLFLSEQDITPVAQGWGTCLLGRFTGRFPGKEAIYDLTRRWPCKSRVTFHRKGWLCFQFGNEVDRETVRQKGPFDIFGIPLLLQPVPENFDPNAAPEVNIPLWIRLVDLPLELWNFTAVSKIASCIGTPLSTDFSTLRRESLDGPRVQVIVNTAMRPKNSIVIQTPSGHFEQKFEYEFFPKFCNCCKMYGHFADECRERQEEYARFGTGPRGKSRDRRRSNSRPRGQQETRGPKQAMGKNGPHLENGGQKGNWSGRQGPQERSRSRPRQQQQQFWKPTGNTYPVNIKYTRNRSVDGRSDAGANQGTLGAAPPPPNRGEGHSINAGQEAGVLGIPKSPNKFDILGEAENVDPKEIVAASKEAHVELVKDILAAAIPPILAGLQSNASLTFQAPYVNSERRRHRSSSRDPRIHREDGKGDEAKDGTVADATTSEKVAEKVVVDEETTEKDVGSTAGNGKKKKNKKHGYSGPSSNGAPVPEVEPIIVAERHAQAATATTDLDPVGQIEEVEGRLSRSEKRGDSSKRKKSKSRSKSRGRQIEENVVIPSHWEDGLEDDPGNAQ